MKHAGVVLRRLVSPRVWILTGVVFALGASTSAFAAGKWAVVNSAGTLVRGNGVASTGNVGTGNYQVTYKSNMTNCAYIATPGDTDGASVSGPIIDTVASLSGVPNGIFVQSKDQSTGSAINDPVHAVTYCGNKVYAVVAADGTLARGSNVASSANLGTGGYEVIFDRNVTKCAYTATIGQIGDGVVANPGTITLVGRAGNKRGVFVRTFDRTGNPVNYPFHIAVNCKGLYAVINGDGTLARGPKVVSSAKLSATPNDGRYEVIFDRDVTTCAYTATVGLPGSTGSITDPITITTASRAGNPNGVFLFIHKTAGTTIDEPFHMQVTC